MQGREHLGQFSNVDQASNPREFVSLLDQLLAQAGQRKRRTYRLMGAAPGHSVLDVGCGTGADVAALAEIVGAQGSAVGVDLSDAMLAEARERTKTISTPVTFRQGDARHLPFGSNTFDACRCERVIEHIPDAQRVIKEMVRVAKPGGRVVAYEPDWGTTAIDSPNLELTERVASYTARTVENGWIGRQLYRLFREAGLDNVAIEADVWTITDFKLGKRLMRLDHVLAHAREAGVLTENEISSWLGALETANQQGCFLGSLTFFYAIGVKRTTGWRSFSIPPHHGSTSI